MYAVIGTAPSVDVAVAAGPFRSLEKATDASGDLEYKGYVAEIVPLMTVDEIDFAAAYDGE